MNPGDLANAAMQAISVKTQLAGLRSRVTIPLVVQKGSYPKNGFPRGEFTNEQERNGFVEKVYQVDAIKILIWLIDNELITIKQSKVNPDAFIFSDIKNEVRL